MERFVQTFLPGIILFGNGEKKPVYCKSQTEDGLRNGSVNIILSTSQISSGLISLISSQLIL